MQETRIKDRFYSLIIPVFNRPDEIETVIKCLLKQTYPFFELIIVESGSTNTAENIVNQYKNKLDIHWFMYKNNGQGFTRNYGMTKAKGEYFIILDSDILLDDSYLENLNQSLNTNYLDAFGGPDKAHSSFTNTQKAIDHVMTSVFTTGGIRGNKSHVGKFYPRSFNMGFSKEVYETTKGFRWPFFGEDIELSKRIMTLGFKIGLVPEAYIYHKRKTSLSKHWKQMNFFGKARINIFKAFPDTLKLTHFFPAVFTVFVFFLLFSTIFLIFTSIVSYSTLVFCSVILIAMWFFLLLYLLLISISALIKHKNIFIALLTIPATFTQMVGYGFGFIQDFVKRVILKKEYRFNNKI